MGIGSFPEYLAGLQIGCHHQGASPRGNNGPVTVNQGTLTCIPEGNICFIIQGHIESPQQFTVGPPHTHYMGFWPDGEYIILCHRRYGS